MQKRIYLLFFLSIFGCVSNQEKGYYSNGQLKYKVPLKFGLRNGTLCQYYEDGNLYLKSEWLNGEKEGKTISFFRNGTPNVIELYSKGMLRDSITRLDSIGNYEEIVNVNNGKKNGLYRAFYPNGNLEIKGWYKDDKKSGRALFYYPDGSIKSRKIYHEDTIAYEVLYTKRGFPKEVYLPVSINAKDSLEYKVLNIKLDYGYYNDGYIGFIAGDLDNKNNLKDTLDILQSKKGINELNYSINRGMNKQNSMQGILFEIDSSDNIQAKYPIVYKW